MRFSQRGSGLIVRCALALALLVGALPAAAQGSAPTWAVVPGIDADTSFSNVFLVDTTRAWAVGQRPANGTAQGVAYRLDLVNGLWQATLEYTAPAALTAVVATTRDEAWAVGAGGLILQRTAGTWQVIPSPVARAPLNTIQMFGAGEEGWAGGAQTDPSTGQAMPVLLHWAQGRWQRDGSIRGPGAIDSIHFGPGGGWLVGSSLLGVWHYANGGWTKGQDPPNCGGQYGGHCGGAFLAVRDISADEAWAVGYSIVPCAECREYASIAHFQSGQWQGGDAPVPALPPAERSSGPGGSQLSGVAFVAGGSGLAVGDYGVYTYPNRTLHPLLLRFSGGQWTPEPLPAATGSLKWVSMLDANHALAVGDSGLILSYGFGAQAAPGGNPGGSKPTDRVADPHAPGVTYFPAVGHTLRGVFLRYWQAHGGQAQFGYPLTEEFQEVSATDHQPYTVQYFERNRFEYHSANAGSPYDVLLGLLGVAVTRGRAQEQPFLPLAAAPANRRFFPPSGHTLAPQFAAYWQDHGGPAVYGYPISEPFPEASPTDGKTYLVQYFERNRFEYHPENTGTPYEVLLGLLGVQVLQQRGWLP